MIRIASAEGGIVRTDTGRVLVAYDPDAFPIDTDHSVLENEIDELRRQRSFAYFAVADEPQAAGVEVEIDAHGEVTTKTSNRPVRRWTQDISSELADAIPTSGPIFEYVNWVHKLTHAPPHLHVASILPVVAYEACRRNYTHEIGGDALHVWTAIIAPSAAGKTTAVSYAQDFSKDYYSRIYSGVQSNWVSLEGSLPGVVSALMEYKDDRHDITPAIIYHHEFSRVLRAEDASELMCQLYDMRDYEKNTRYDQKRKDKGEDVKTKIVAPRMSCIVTSTRPSMQKVFKSEHMYGGLASRFVWFYVNAMEPEKLMQRQLIDKKGREVALAAWSNWCGVLDSFEVMGTSRVITISMDAEEVFTEYFDNDLRSIIADPENDLASIAARSNTAVMRVAALYSMSIGSLGIDGDCARRAVNLMRMSMKQAGILLPTLSETDFGRHIGQVLEALVAAGPRGLSRRELYKVMKKQPKDVVDRVKDTLVDAGGCQEYLLPAGPRGGRPSMRLIHSDHLPKVVPAAPAAAQADPNAPVQAAVVQLKK